VTDVEPPIVLAAMSEDPYMEPDQPVVLHANGNLTCGPTVLKPPKNRRFYREQYDLIAQYLRNRSQPFDVSDIREPNIQDVIDRMQNEGRDCITLEELMDIFVHQDRIYLIKTSMLNRLSRNAERRWWRERNAADPAKAKAMDTELRAKQESISVRH
jgi:hypothetical protein